MSRDIDNYWTNQTKQPKSHCCAVTRHKGHHPILLLLECVDIWFVVAMVRWLLHVGSLSFWKNVCHRAVVCMCPVERLFAQILGLCCTNPRRPDSLLSRRCRLSSPSFTWGPRWVRKVRPSWKKMIFLYRTMMTMIKITWRGEKRIKIQIWNGPYPLEKKKKLKRRKTR